VPLFTLFALTALLILGATNSNNVKGGTLPAEARRATSTLLVKARSADLTTIFRLQCPSTGGTTMDLKQQFEASIEKAKGLPNQSNETLLELYSLYKQATVGDVEGDRPIDRLAEG
jgi:hypothetical protein